MQKYLEIYTACCSYFYTWTIRYMFYSNESTHYLPAVDFLKKKLQHQCFKTVANRMNDFQESEHFIFKNKCFIYDISLDHQRFVDDMCRCTTTLLGKLTAPAAHIASSSVNNQCPSQRYSNTNTQHHHHHNQAVYFAVYRFTSIRQTVKMQVQMGLVFRLFSIFILELIFV